MTRATADDVMVEFYRLCDLATEAEDTIFDRFHEPEYSIVLEHLHRHPDRRYRFGAELIEMSQFPGQVSADLVAFCMHELRWPEVKAAASQALEATGDPRGKRVNRVIIEAFDDDWDDEGYLRWQGGKPR